MQKSGWAHSGKFSLLAGFCQFSRIPSVASAFIKFRKGFKNFFFLDSPWLFKGTTQEFTRKMSESCAGSVRLLAR